MMADIELAARQAVSKALHVDLTDWPADQPLAEVPDGMFDSLARLESISLLERELGVGRLPLEDAADLLTTIRSIVDWVTEQLAGRE